MYPEYDDPEAGFHATFSKPKQNQNSISKEEIKNTDDIIYSAAPIINESAETLASKGDQNEQISVKPSIDVHPLSNSEGGKTYVPNKVKVCIKDTKARTLTYCNLNQNGLRRSEYLKQKEPIKENSDIIYNLFTNFAKPKNEMKTKKISFQERILYV